MIDFLNIMLGFILCLIAIGYGKFLSFIYLKIHKMKFITWCCVKGDFVRSKECGGECETCKHFVTVDDLK